MNPCRYLSLNTGQKTPKPLRLLQKVEKPVPRPPTPTCPAPPPGIEEREQALILLQRVIRGRSRQAKVTTHPLTTSHIIHCTVCSSWVLQYTVASVDNMIVSFTPLTGLIDRLH